MYDENIAFERLLNLYLRKKIKVKTSDRSYVSFYTQLHLINQNFCKTLTPLGHGVDTILRVEKKAESEIESEISSTSSWGSFLWFFTREGSFENGINENALL